MFVVEKTFSNQIFSFFEMYNVLLLKYENIFGQSQQTNKRVLNSAFVPKQFCTKSLTKIIDLFENYEYSVYFAVLIMLIVAFKSQLNCDNWSSEKIQRTIF